MHLRKRLSLIAFSTLLIGPLPTTAFAQQIVQRGPLGRPTQVLDETQQWSTPLLVSSDHDVEIYLPDVSSPEWLRRNYVDFENKGQYVLSMFTFYRTPKSCRANQIGWGFSDAAHLDACDQISYRLRQITVDIHQKTVTLIVAGMIDQDGQLDPESLQTHAATRRWADLDANSQEALKKGTDLISEQMSIYDRKMQGVH